MQLLTQDDALGAAELFFEEYEQQVANYKAAKAASDSGVKTKEVLSALEFTEEQEAAVNELITEFRSRVFHALMEDPDISVLLYDALSDYNSDNVKEFRDSVVSRYKKAMHVEDDTPEPEIDEDFLSQLRTQAEAFWRIAGGQEVSPSKKDLAENPHLFRTKKSKSGEVSPAFSRKPNSPSDNKESAGGQEVSNGKGVTTYFQRYEVDGEAIPARTSLSEVGLWYLSSPDWTVSVAEIKSAVEKQTGKKFGELGSDDFEIEINGHTLKRYREKK